MWGVDGSSTSSTNSARTWLRVRRTADRGCRFLFPIHPGCGAQAVHCDLDHTHPYPAGITCQCDLAPACRRHHRCKQAPGWRLTQPEPGVMHWTTPSGRSYTTKPTVYEM